MRADQKLVAIYLFSVERFRTKLKNLQFLEKVSSLVHFDYFFSKV